VNNGFIVLRLQEIGLKVTQANLRLNRWTDVKHFDGHTYGYIVNEKKNICSWVRRGTDDKGCFSLDSKPFSISHKSFIKQLIEDNRKEQKAYFDKAADLAKQYFELDDFGITTPYLDKKRVQKFNCKTDRNSNVIIPLRILVRDKAGFTNSYIKTLQTIKFDGTKLLAKGGQKKGAMGLLNFPKSLLPKPDNKTKMDNFTGEIIIAEGYATAATLAQLTSYLSVMAVDAGNVKQVAQQIIASYPKAKIIIAADNDLKLKETNQDSNKWVWSNTGVEAAIITQQEIICSVAIPDFKGQKSADKLTDWNDYFIKYGKFATIKHFFGQVK
jgi:phage/plasmid primase-like uncharacterized protein